MAHRRLGEVEEARAWLVRSRSAAERWETNRHREPVLWTQRFELQVLLGEAEEVVASEAR